MFDFFDSLEKKRAFKKALKEINSEDAERAQHPIPAAQSKPAAPAGAGGQPQVAHAATTRRALTNPFRRPETTAIDLKYFKDWRKVDTVKSNNPVYPKKAPVAAPATTTVDEHELVKDENPIKKPTTADTIEKFGIVKKEQSSVDRDITEYLRALREERAKRRTFAPTATPIKPVITQPEPKPEVKAEPKSEVTTDKDKIKVEVIDFGGEKQQPKPKPKPKTTRKPRGKNKRRFDADVISSVDWK